MFVLVSKSIQIARSKVDTIWLAFLFSECEKQQTKTKMLQLSESKMPCALCTRRRSVFYCPRCTSDMLQQRRTMLVALQADVAVLRKKTEFALNVRK